MPLADKEDLQKLFENMDDYDLCDVINKKLEQYTPEAKEIAIIEFGKRKSKNPKIEKISLKQEKKRIQLITRERRAEAKEFFYKHIFFDLILSAIFIILVIAYATR
ncbi:MAG TPA: hypothetical protein VHT96_12475 [Clostridia bacterium]|nr:hypothetical protein [Clostridia bacterium]